MWRDVCPDDEVEVMLVGETTEAVTCAKGMRVLPDTSWDELGDVDVLIYPGGRGTRRSSATRRSVRESAR